MEMGTKVNLGLTNDRQDVLHTTIAMHKGTKERIDSIKAPGQCYDGFIKELVDYWERYKIGSSLCGPGRPIRREMER